MVVGEIKVLLDSSICVYGHNIYLQEPSTNHAVRAGWSVGCTPKARLANSMHAREERVGVTVVGGLAAATGERWCLTPSEVPRAKPSIIHGVTFIENRFISNDAPLRNSGRTVFRTNRGEELIIIHLLRNITVI